MLFKKEKNLLLPIVVTVLTSDFCEKKHLWITRNTKGIRRNAWNAGI